MTAFGAITSVGALAEKVRIGAADVGRACEQAASQWDGLGRAGGQREDHAAALLQNVRDQVCLVRRMLERVEQQLALVIADPWKEG